MENGSWLTTPQQLSVGSGVIFPTAVADTLGHVHLVWANDLKADPTTALFRLHYTRWDGDTLYGPIQIVDAPLGDLGQSMGALALPASGWLDPAHQHLVWAGGGVREISQIFFSTQLPNQVSLADIAPPNDVADHPTLAGSGATNLHAVWMQGSDVRRILYSHWDGVRWANPQLISQPDFDSTAPDIAIDANGLPHVVWHAHDKTSNALTYYTRFDGATWQTPTVISDEFDAAGVPNIAIDAADEIHVVWEMRSAENSFTSAIYYRRTVGGPNQWQPIERVSTLGRIANRPQLALDNADTPHVVWYDVGDEEIFYSTFAPSGWTVPENVSNTPPSTVGITIASQAPGIAIDGSGQIHIAWKDTLSGTQLDTIYYATRGKQSWLRQTILSQPEVGHDMDQAIGVNVHVLAAPNGNVHILWSDNDQRGTLQVFNSNNLGRASGTTWSSPTIITPATPQGNRPSGYVDDQGRLHLLWTNPEGGNQVFHGTVERFDWLKIVDESARPVPNALIYKNGVQVGQSDGRGLAFLDNLRAGDELVALAPVAEYTGQRAGHASPDSLIQNWAYRVYLTNWSYVDNGSGDRRGTPAKPPGSEQLIAVSTNAPLILLNLLVSIEWEAGVEYTDTISRALRAASSYLFDASNGQMAIGNAAIYVGGQFWTDADVQIRAFNDNRPNAGINGLRDGLRTPVRVGPSWSGERFDAADNGAWDQPNGYRTLVHELGHYALGLWDSYVRIVYDANNDPIDKESTTCTGGDIKTNNQDIVNATLMDYQYNATEFSMQNTASWSTECTQTQQFQENENESDWETIQRLFEDTTLPGLRTLSPYGDATWRLQTPLETGVLPGPHLFPLQALPTIHVAEPVTSTETPLQLEGPQSATQLASVTLYVRKEGYTEAIDQGYTDRTGQIVLRGARTGDRVSVLSRDTVYGGTLAINAGVTNTLALVMTNPQVQAAQRTETSPRYVRIFPGSRNRSLDLQLVGVSAGASLAAELTLTGREIGATAELAHSTISGEYRGSLVPSLPAELNTLVGLSQIRITGTDVNDQPIYLAGSMTNETLRYGLSQSIVSPDGALRLFIPSNGLLSEQDQLPLVIMEHSLFNTPNGANTKSPMYQVRLGGSIARFAAPSVLTIVPTDDVSNAEHMQIYRFDETAQTWVPLDTNWDAENLIASTAILQTGYFGLFTRMSDTATPIPTFTATPLPSITITPSITPTATSTPNPHVTITATVTPPPAPSLTAQPGATLTPTPEATSTPTRNPNKDIHLPIIKRD